MSQMKTVKTETDLQSSMESRLQRVLRKSSELVAKTKSRAAESVELATVKVAAVKVQAVESVGSVKQRIIENVNQTAQKAHSLTAATLEQAMALKATAGTSYMKLRSDGMRAWVAENWRIAAGMTASAVRSVREAANSQCCRAVTAASDATKTCKEAVRSHMAALLATSKKTLETAKAKAIKASTTAKTVAKNGHVQATAVGVAGGAAAVGASGMAAGGALGAVVGLVPALFTFGMSIPVGAALGAGAGLAAGATVGAVSGGAAGYGVYAKKDKIKELKSGTITKVSSGVELVQLKAFESADYIKDKAASARAKASASAEYVTRRLTTRG
eukprot:TRINITY_DN4103_c0_g1_i5.p1 TRINITY_DN4103_c0_g1~~TRINITY_DN4103_c0_g1_i5.p1  ORF type:complete len:330 (+),score=94.64 TRINITY_DN4103_c0_g1_i5:94-1083(+)